MPGVRHGAPCDPEFGYSVYSTIARVIKTRSSWCRRSRELCT